jgi:pyridoxal phosphate enzyme (YggS family)
VTRAEEIADNLARVRERIATAARAAGRPPEAIRLLAVSKKMPADDVRAAAAAGQRAFGENYAQELRDKSALLAGEPTPPEWHFIGPLQSNKVKYVAGHAALVHSVDSAALLDAIEARGVPQRCLVQVNVAGEASKKGVPAGELPALLDRFAAMKNVRCDGLMLIPPRGDARPHFAALRALRDREAAIARPNVDLRELSMGMTDDLEVAVEEGATIVRVGTAIFGPRPAARMETP